MTLAKLFLIFFIYAVIGWFTEVLYVWALSKKYVNRGFLIGPYCPIYGCGSILILSLLKRYYSDPIVVFFMTIVICSLLEYSTSFILEKLFKTRWWDYSTRKFNINGRICLETLIPFGLLGLVVLYGINPIITKLLGLLTIPALNTISLIFAIIFITDLVVSVVITNSIKGISFNVKSDSTEKITKMVRQIIIDNNKLLYKRVIKAFPMSTMFGKKNKNE